MLLILLLGGLLGATLVRFAPGFGVDEEELDSRLNRESIQTLRQSSTQNQNILGFYVHYLASLLRGDLGVSKTLQQPVTRLLAERFPETLKSVSAGLVFGWCLGLSLATAVVMSRNRLFDLFATMIAGSLLCVPAAVMAILFVIWQAPVRLLIGLVVFPKIFRYARNLLARGASLPHVLTARAKGAGAVRVLFWHILPVVTPQLLALAGVSISIAFAAAIPMEVLCDMPGIGQLAWKAALGRDLQLLVNLTLVVTAITLLGNSASDLLGHSIQTGEA